jgi:hypothetical protein
MKPMPSALLVVALLAASGCGGNNATMSGKVTYKGRAVTSGSVVVLNPDNTASKGEIQPDGTYTVSDVARGHVKIGVLSAEPSKGPSGDKTKAGWFPLPHPLGNPGTSKLECEVTATRFQHDIDIK